MQAGDKVPVYQDPITRQDLEGEAQLVELYRPDEGDGLSMWWVEFDDEPGQTYMRTINNRAL
jgi:hypothetical protein